MRLILAFAFIMVGLAAAPASDDTTFVIENPTGLDIVEIYASPSHSPDGPGEPLPQSAVPGGTSAEFTIANGSCAYELFFVFADGRWYHSTADFCDFDTLVFNPVPSGWIEPPI